MKKGQKIRNVSDVAGPGIGVGSIYTLTRDADERFIYFNDYSGVERLRRREYYELAQPEDDKVLALLKDIAVRALRQKDFNSGRYSTALELLREGYGLKVVAVPQVDFVPING